jgi:hypothetical protein
MAQSLPKKIKSFVKKFLSIIRPRFSLHYVSYTILTAIIVFSLFNITHAGLYSGSTPNPGHPWTEVGFGAFQFTNDQTAFRTYTLPDADASILTDSALITVPQGGTGASTLTGVVLGNGASALTSLALSAGQSIRMNAGGTAYEAYTPGMGTWGSITGTLSAQTDLQNALNAKQNTITTGTTLQYLRGDLSLATFPTTLSSFTNDLGNYGGFLTSLSGALLANGSTALTANWNVGAFNITASKFVTSGGTSSQFVKGDGSLDSSTYLTGNQSITLGGILSGSGTTSITASAASGYYMPSTTDQTNWGTAYTNRITSLTTTNSSGAATLSSNTLNIPHYTLSGLGGQANLNLNPGTYIDGDVCTYTSGIGGLLNCNTAPYQTASSALTSVAGLSWSSGTPFVKMTAAGTFALDTNTYQPLNTNLTSIGGLANASGWLHNDGSGTFTYSTPAVPTIDAVLNAGATSATHSLTLTAGTLTAATINDSGLTASKLVFTDASKNLTSTGIGTSSQFIKGDGSLDSSTYLTGNQSITLSGVVTGSGATSITTSYAAGTINSLNGLTIAQGDLLYGSGANALSNLAKSSTANQYLSNGGTSNNPVWASFPTFNQDTTGTSAKTNALNSATTIVNVSSATAPTNGQVLTATSGTAATWQTPTSSGADALGTYIVQTATHAPTNAQVLASLGNGILKNTTTTGVLSIASAGDFPTLNQSTSGTAAGLSATLVPSSGGTGVANNNASTLTISGNYGTTFTVSGTTTLTLPTSGTLLSSVNGLLATGATTGATSQAQAFTDGVITGKIYPSADSTTSLQFDKADGTTNVLNVDTTNGRLGIGTTAPGELLSLGLAGTTKGVLSLAGNTSGKIIIQPQAAAGTYTLTLPATAGGANQFLQTDGSGNLSWASVGNTQWTSSGLDIYYTLGNVGIGTTSPDAGLSVYGTSYTTTPNVLNVVGTVMNNGNGQGINLQGGNSNFSLTGTYLGGNIYLTPGIGYSSGTAVGGNVLMAVDSSNNPIGKVGIGTNAPGYKLDVNGDVNIASGSHYKINGTNLSYSDVGAQVAGSYLTGNQSITLGGILSGSGTTSITAAAASGYYMPSTTDQTNWGTAYTNRITTFTTTGSSGAATLSSNTLNIPNYTLAGLGGQPSNTNLSTIAALTNASGWLHNNGSGTFAYSTPTYSDVGAQQASSALTSVAGLSWSSGTPFVKMTAAGTFALDTNTYLTSVGTGVANQLTYWSGTNTLGSLDTATYPSLTELSYVKGVTSGIQSQLNAKGTFTLPSLTSGSVLFSNGSTIAQDNSNFFWDATNHRLGVGTASPSALLSVGSSSQFQVDSSGNISTSGTLAETGTGTTTMASLTNSSASTFTGNILAVTNSANALNGNVVSITGGKLSGAGTVLNITGGVSTGAAELQTGSLISGNFTQTATGAGYTEAGNI